MMCDGNSFSKGNTKPVTLVRMVKRRKIAVMPGIGVGAEQAGQHDQAGDDGDQADDRHAQW